MGIADMKARRGTGAFACLGLGSCVGVAAFDPIERVGGMLHVMLPEAFEGRAGEKPGKFADTGVPAFVDLMEREGARRARLRIALAGGAQVFKFGEAAGSRMEIGSRNVKAVRGMLEKLGLRAMAQDVGGDQGRTMVLDVATGEVRLRGLREERTLCRLGA